MTLMTAWLIRVGMGCLLLVLVAGAAVAASAPAVDHRMRGKADAPVTLIEYSDFTCGYCLKFFKETWPKIQARYVDTGKVRFLYKDYPRADQGPGVTAALAARCAGDQGTYWPMHDRLFAADGRLDVDSYSQHAKAIGLDQTKFRQCLRDAPHVQAIFQDRDEANGWGFHGTPGFVLMRTTQQPTTKNPAIAIPGAFPFEAFEEEIEKLLASPGATQK
ncbi:MAG: DsbA family protein [Nitrospira sp.]|jgi:protein-disulfide isomerase|nr:DsbA family protein [Nitrospira sp.]MBP6605360.1 DsbA family protein [Nitrospira sp.]MCI1280597.1 DsbA family protein [Nitrospira sp.]HQY59575.1 DsbA family protein [Nitrospira sp.]HRA95680.1 DsbA family protein [Nitrospira sp.]